MMCESCHFTNECARKPQNGCRCKFYVKGDRIDLNEDIPCAVLSEIVRDFDIEDVKKIVEEFESLCD